MKTFTLSLVAVVLLAATCLADEPAPPLPQSPRYGDNDFSTKNLIVGPSKMNKHYKKCNHGESCSYQRSCALDHKYYDDGVEQKVCLHKTLLPHFSFRDGVAVGCIFFGTMLAASAGIGGGGLNTPVYILVLGFIIQEAIPLSHVTVFGNAVAQLIINYPQRHPFVQEPGKPLIDYAVPLILLPPQLGGNNLGVLLNPVIPPNILYILAELLLLYATFRVFQKGIAMYKAEAEAAEDIANDVVSEKSVATEHSDAYGGLYNPKEEIRVNSIDRPLRPVDDEKATEILLRESKIPMNYFFLMFTFWVLFAGAYVIMKESGTCSTAYWVTLGCMYPMLLIFLYIGSVWLARDRAEREEAGLAPIEGDIVWTPTKLIAAPVAASGVGLVAGLLGLGGGELMAPLLLELGMLPKAASATSAYMIIWTTSSNIIHYAVGNDLPSGYSTLFCSIGFVGGLLGRYLAIKFVSKYNRQSVIALSLGLVLAISMILFAYRAATTSQDHPWKPASLC
eukprot:TRINITY_DN6263_c1_g1_i1.p1 TRINITY_DN6263_c1_g1~~TRINITY_DN6263_c1_g1_i1.p1  ORF type:complete len:507 (+),score=107.16 TRINITY_DN6263_c1_g1_i1:73-1593(+)